MRSGLRRACAVAIVVLGTLGCLDPAAAQPVAGRATIGLLTLAGATAGAEWVEAFRRELRERGWVEGQNLTILYRYADVQGDRLPALADGLVEARVQVIAAFGAPAILAATRATPTIPIVFETLADAVAMGFVSNLGRPGGNVTGVTGFASELGGKWVELLREAVPGLARVALLSDPGNPNAPSIVATTKRAAHALGLSLQIVEARDAAALERVFAAMRRDRVGAAIVPPGPLFLRERQRIAALAVSGRLPTISGIPVYSEAGGLMAYGTTLEDNWRRAAAYVDRILRGAAPGDLPVERPTKFELSVNLGTAAALGLTIPPVLRFRADRLVP